MNQRPILIMVHHLIETSGDKFGVSGLDFLPERVQVWGVKPLTPSN